MINKTENLKLNPMKAIAAKQVI